MLCVKVLVFLQNICLEKYDRILRYSLCKVTIVELNDSQFLQAVPLAAIGCLGLSSSCLLALPAFLASAKEAKATLSEIFVLKHEDGT